MDTSCAYAALGLRDGASRSQIRRAYLDVSKRTHPDKTGGGSSAAFRAAKDAYDLLMSDAATPTAVASSEGGQDVNPSNNDASNDDASKNGAGQFHAEGDATGNSNPRRQRPRYDWDNATYTTASGYRYTRPTHPTHATPSEDVPIPMHRPNSRYEKQKESVGRMMADIYSREGLRLSQEAMNARQAQGENRRREKKERVRRMVNEIRAGGPRRGQP